MQHAKNKTMKNHFKEIQQIFSASKPKETHVYLRNVEKVIDAAKARIKAHEIEAHENEDYDRAHAYHMAIIELAFVTSEIMLQQLKENE
tara:strand:- start:544 stop:810 length:267 start_codon:yes stop_codon:yes gene_type:complete